MKLSKISTCAAFGWLYATVLVGCEDSAAKQRDNVQASLTKINRELQVAMASAAVGEDASLMRLNQVITQLQGVTGGEAGQQASKALLAATAYRELADIHAAEIAEIEAQHRDARNAIRTNLNAALRINAVAAGLLQVDGTADRDALQRELQTAKSSANELSQKFMQLGEPIAKQTSQNEAQVKEVERLRIEVGNLLRRAQELGHADGFDTYKQATTIGRQADEIEIKVAQSEIELDYQLNPEHKSVATQVNQLQGMIEAVEKAQTYLTAFASASASDVETTRAEIKRLAGEINTTLEAINEGRSETLAPLYGEAIAALEKATSQADAAANADAQTAKLLSARSREALGRLHWSQASALADHQVTLEQLVNASKELGLDGKYAQQLGESSVAHDQAIQQAREQYAAASEQLANVQSRGDQDAVAQYQQNLASVIAALEGKSAPASEPDAAAPSSSDGASNQSSGAESAEALVATIKSMNGLQDLERVLDLIAPIEQMPGSTPGMKALFDTLRPIARGIASLDVALQKQFNKGLLDVGGEMAQAGGAGAGLPDFSKVELVKADENRGTLRLPGAPMGKDTLDIVQINGRWYFDPKGMGLDNFGGGGASAAAQNPQAKQMADAFMKGIAQTVGGFGTVISELTRAVDAGQYASIDAFKLDAEAKFKQTMESSMFGGMMMGVDQAMKNRPRPRAQ